ncbi:MAG: aspartate aminotransferase family protein, partial [Bosea sp.]|uniref:aminotransferase family protein n=1 Tax=Bosea sp. (in: a-proteobacteria) TaxID=1871050 RepID=UPI0023977A35|nr:aspartate aminotransferase family protein [Bosea sp. (in: a-proteobacteria)]
IDGIGSLWYCQVGYGREEIIKAVSDQLGALAYNTFPPWTCDVAEEAAARVVGLSSTPDGRAYLCTSGSEAIDTAFKIARAVAQLRGEAERQIIVRRSRAYHGVNVGGTSAQGIASNREGWGDLMPHVVEVEADSLGAAEELFERHGDRIAAVVCEPVQAAGGVHPPVDDDYLKGLRALCTRHGALLIFDEVITGFGRTGHWFASQTYDVVPDLMTFAKGATSGYQPLGGVVASRSVCDVLEDDPDYLFHHGLTFSDPTAACAACLANIEIMERERLVERADHVGSRLSGGLERLADRGDIRGLRGVGALWAAQLNNEDAETTVAVRDAMLDLGVIVRPLGDAIAFSPPLVMEDDDVDRMVGALAQAI